MFNVTRLTGSARSTYAEVLPTIRQHLRISDDDTSENDLLMLYFSAACGDAEQITGRAILGGLFEYTVDAFPGPHCELILPTPPLGLFSSLASYVTGVGELSPAVEFVRFRRVFSLRETRLEASDYRIVYGGYGPSRIVSTDVQYGFPIIAGVASAVTIQYSAGYAIGGVGNSDSVSYLEMPDAMLGAILDLTAARYSIRSSQIIGTGCSEPSAIAARDTLERYRVNPHLYERF